MAEYLEKACLHPGSLEDMALTPKLHKSILELGAGTGLGGLFGQALVQAKDVCLTDMCPSSLELIQENVRINEATIDVSAFTVQRLEWGEHALGSRSFDLILASDVIYFAESLQPLVDCIKYYLNN